MAGAGVKDWAVQRLRSLDFEGDANALAAYVDALAENNAEHEGGDLTKLRAEASSELSDFLGAQSSRAFVSDLVAHLARLRGPANPPAPSHAPHPPNPPAPTVPTAKQEPLLDVDEKPKLDRRDRDRDRERERERSDRDRRSRRDRDRDRDRERERDLHSHRDRERDRERERMRDRERDRGRSGDGGTEWKRDAPMRDSRERGAPQSRRVVGIGGGAGGGGGGGGNAQVDLRNTLSRRRGGGGADGPQKRPREEAQGRNNHKQQRVDKGRSPTAVPGMMVPPGVPPGPGGLPPFFPPQMIMAMGGGPGGPAPDPAMFAQMQQIFAAQAAAAAAANAGPGPGSGGRGGHRGGRGGRGRGGRGGGGMGRENGSVSTSTSTLIVRNVPEDKFNFGDLNTEFSKFGSITNIRLMPPGRAMLEFATRPQAQAALSSVDSVFGNRHVKLNWARDNDSDGVRKRKPDTNGNANSAGGEEETEDAETVLQRKRQEIKDARAEEERRKKAYEDAIVEQKQLFATLEGGSTEQKKKALGRMKELDGLIRAHDAEKAARAQPAPQPPTLDKPWKRQRTFQRHAPNAYSLDNRPKVVRITGANQGISPDAAAAIFRDTDRADAGPDGTWTLHFSTRAAAESAIRARNVLRRGFGINAKTVIVKIDTNLQAQQQQNNPALQAQTPEPVAPSLPTAPAPTTAPLGADAQ